MLLSTILLYFLAMRVVKFTDYSWITHEILSYPHFPPLRVNFYLKTDGTG